MNRLSTGESIFKIFSYTFAILLAIMCLFPLVYAIAVSLSGQSAFISGKVTLFPVDIQFDAFLDVIKDKSFWSAYGNTVFMTIYGTAFSMVISIFAAYALTRKNLAGRNKLSFMIVFTMWFSAGLIPTFNNYKMLGITNLWGFVIGFGAQAFNIMLLRNSFAGISSEIEEAARVDGANEFQILTSIYLPMSKPAIATVTLFYALNRWNGYYWAQILLSDSPQYIPLQAYLRSVIDGKYENNENFNPGNLSYDPTSIKYAAILLSIIPIIIIYPYLQKFFTAGVNVGGVKE